MASNTLSEITQGKQESIYALIHSVAIFIVKEG